MGVTVASIARKSVTPASRAGKQRLDQFEVADGDRVEHQAVLPFVEADAVDVVERAALGGADVVEDGARGRCRRGLAGQAEAFEREHAKMIFQQREWRGRERRSSRRAGSRHSPGCCGRASAAFGQAAAWQDRCRRLKQRQPTSRTATSLGRSCCKLFLNASRRVVRREIRWREIRRWRDPGRRTRRDRRPAPPQPRKLFSSELSDESAAVPGVTTRVTSRRTSFLARPGDLPSARRSRP